MDLELGLSPIRNLVDSFVLGGWAHKVLQDLQVQLDPPVQPDLQVRLDQGVEYQDQLGQLEQQDRQGQRE